MTVHQEVLSHLAEMGKLAEGLKSAEEVQRHLNEAYVNVADSHAAHLAGDHSTAFHKMSRANGVNLTLARSVFTGKSDRKALFDTRYGMAQKAMLDYCKESPGAPLARAKQYMDTAQQTVDDIADQNNLWLPGSYDNKGGQKAPNGE